MISEIEKTVPKFLLKYLRHIIFNEIVTHPNHKPTLRKWVSHVLNFTSVAITRQCMVVVYRLLR